MTDRSVAMSHPGRLQRRTLLIGLALASALISVLYLSGSVYMLEVYDRVLTSRSIPTLVGLSVLVLYWFTRARWAFNSAPPGAYTYTSGAIPGYISFCTNAA